MGLQSTRVHRTGINRAEKIVCLYRSVETQNPWHWKYPEIPSYRVSWVAVSPT